ncbi:hypothetical protein L0Y49_05100, partial [bacterium]|nr:hypothetical protein [bacterium]
VSRLLEKTLEIECISLVVGKPASGKSLFLRYLSEHDERNIVINTDAWTRDWKDMMREKFGTSDLLAYTLEHDEKVANFLMPFWFRKLKNALRDVPKGSRVFIEAAFGMVPHKSLFRFVGGKVLYIGCGDDCLLENRLRDRGTPEHIPFIKRIPDLESTREIVREHKLNLYSVESNGSKEQLKEKAELFNNLAFATKPKNYA